MQERCLCLPWLAAARPADGAAPAGTDCRHTDVADEFDPVPFYAPAVEAHVGTACILPSAPTAPCEACLAGAPPASLASDTDCRECFMQKHTWSHYRDRLEEAGVACGRAGGRSRIEYTGGLWVSLAVAGTVALAAEMAAGLLHRRRSSARSGALYSLAGEGSGSDSDGG